MPRPIGIVAMIRSVGDGIPARIRVAAAISASARASASLVPQRAMSGGPTKENAPMQKSGIATRRLAVVLLIPRSPRMSSIRGPTMAIQSRRLTAATISARKTAVGNGLSSGSALVETAIRRPVLSPELPPVPDSLYFFGECGGTVNLPFPEESERRRPGLGVKVLLMSNDRLRHEENATIEEGAVGRSLLRVEDKSLLTGRSTFVDDLPSTDALEVAFARSSIAHGRLLAVDTSIASSLPGVEGVFTSAELDIPPIIPPNDNPDVNPPPQPVLADGKVRYAGEPVAVAVASTRYEAEDACEQLIVEIEELEPLVDLITALEPDAIEIHDGQSNVAVDFERSEGDVEAALARAETVIERTFTTPRHSALPIETRAVLARPAAGGVEIWTSSQAPHKVRQLVAELLGLEPEVVRVITPSVGGGFGVKAHVYPEEIVLPALALKLGRPVKWVEDRAENLASSTHARAQQITVRAGLDANRILSGMDVEMVCDQGAYGAYPHGISLEAMTTSGMLPGPYRLSDFRVRVRTAITNKSPMGAYRGVGFVISQPSFTRGWWTCWRRSPGWIRRWCAGQT